MLLSVPGKVFVMIILDSYLKVALNENLRDEQAGFHQNGSCTNHIIKLQLLIEQSLEWQTPFYIVFVDIQKAFDIVHGDVF
jgi:hypothetical protein